MWFVEGSINGVAFTKLVYNRIKRDANDNTKNVSVPFVIGRREGDLIYSSDRRVSRTHAHIHVDTSNKLFITDLSKFGTKINDKEMKKKTQQELCEHDRVCVGIASSTFVIQWIEFVALFSRIPSETRNAMKTLILKMGGTLSQNNEWNANVTHLFIPNKDLPITAKVISAIINDKQIVTMEWLKYLFKNGCIPSSAWCTKHMPSNLQKWLQTGTANARKHGIKRSHLFKHKLFVFMNRTLMQNNNKIITDCSGHVMLKSQTDAINNAGNNLTQYAVFDENNTCSIANAILSCNMNGSENEIEWISMEKGHDIKRKRKREEMDPKSHESPSSPPPKKKHKPSVKRAESMVMTVSPRKLKCTQFESIRQLKSQCESQLEAVAASTSYTSCIYRNLSALTVNNSAAKKHKQLRFKGIAQKDEYAELDAIDDESAHLEKQKELYSKENICKLQQEIIEMDLIINKQCAIAKPSQPNENEVNFKAFKGNPHYLKAMQWKINHLVEFDTDFRNRDNYEEIDEQFNDKQFRKQREREEKQENEINDLFSSKKRAKKKTTKNKKKRKRKQMLEDNEQNHNRKGAKRRRKK